MNCAGCGASVRFVDGPWGPTWESVDDGDTYCDDFTDQASMHRPEAAPTDPEALAKWLLRGDS